MQYLLLHNLEALFLLKINTVKSLLNIVDRFLKTVTLRETKYNKTSFTRG